MGMVALPLWISTSSPLWSPSWTLLFTFLKACLSNTHYSTTSHPCRWLTAGQRSAWIICTRLWSSILSRKSGLLTLLSAKCTHLTSPCCQSHKNWTANLFFTVDHGMYHWKFRARDLTAIQSLCESLTTWATAMPGKCLKSNSTWSRPSSLPLPWGASDLGQGYSLLRAQDRYTCPKKPVHCYFILVAWQKIPMAGVQRSLDGHAFDCQTVNGQIMVERIHQTLGKGQNSS